MKTKNPVGRPKQAETKKHLGLRLSNDVINIIRSKDNQVAYIEALVRKDNKNNPPAKSITGG